MTRTPPRLAPLLLQAPPFHSRVPALGQVLSAWDRIVSHPAGADAARHPACLALRDNRVGGRFWASDPAGLPSGTGLILVCAPTDPAGATALWRAALRENDAAGLALVLPTPGPLPRFRPLAEEVRRCGGRLVTGDADPHALLDRAAGLRIAGIGILPALGLVCGLPVWRHDRAGTVAPEDPARALALLLSATRYEDPFSGRPSTAEATIALLADWRRVMRANRGIAVCVGMSLWKRRRIAELFATADPRGAPPFRRRAAAAVRLAGGATGMPGAIAAWSTRMPSGLAERAASSGVPVHRVEDGFIRSLGLGSDLLPPASVIVDGSGIYFDPSGPSDLETLLATHPFDDAIRGRARLLIDRLVRSGISKYAAGGEAPVLDAPAGRRVVLVPGQVGDDLSVRLGGGPIQDNLQLLREVRAAKPDAFIVYRPHPDVDAGHRAGAIPDAVALRLADRICRGGAMAPLIHAVDEVHTLTSLAGFEAILRGRLVATYGQPFYAGWGLTIDRSRFLRRNRSICVEELAAATLLLYPRYVDPRTRLPCGPEVLIDRLADASLWRPTLLMRLRRLQGRTRRRFHAAGSGSEEDRTIQGVADA